MEWNTLSVCFEWVGGWGGREKPEKLELRMIEEDQKQFESWFNQVNYRWPLWPQKIKNFPQKIWLKWSDQMNKYIFHTFQTFKFSQANQKARSTNSANQSAPPIQWFYFCWRRSGSKNIDTPQSVEVDTPGCIYTILTLKGPNFKIGRASCRERV